MKRFGFYILVVLCAFILQNNVFAYLPIIDATPNLLLIVVFSFGFIRGRTEGMLIGFFSGLLMDICFSNVIGYYALIYLIIGYINGMIGHLFYTDGRSYH